MMERLVKKAEAIARSAQQRATEEVAARAEELVGQVSIEGERIVLSGRGLLRRWLTDPALRFIAERLT